ncbi:MAG: amylo-alpha-1,6-glucosidase [Nevskia sp.]|nr:amylo-alpha-1,6-glucosidase [Nevskia sp.]
MATPTSPVPATLAPAEAFHIAAAASPRERNPRTLKHGDSFAVFDARGDLDASLGEFEGLYHLDTRIVSRMRLLLNGQLPVLLSSTVQDDNALFSADLTNGDYGRGRNIVLRRELIHINRLRFLLDGTCYERLLVRNYHDAPLHLRLTLLFAADFADLFEVRGTSRAQRGSATAACDDGARATLRYRGLDEVERVTAVEFDPAPQRLEATLAEFELDLQPRESRRLFLRFGAEPRAAGRIDGRSFYRGMRSARHGLHRAGRQMTGLESGSAQFNRAWRRSTADLVMLITDTAQGPYPYAGTPWYNTAFGRDGLLTALMMLWMDPGVARGVLRFLAARQATEADPTRDAEPGKILHETRHGEMARLREVPFGLYYGSVDSTPLFVYLLAEYFRATGDIETVRELWPNVEAALGWIDNHGDRDGDGFVEYYRQTRDGLDNQGWKDSFDAIFHRDGSPARGAIALCEVQAYVYGAKLGAAAMAAAMDRPEQAALLRRQAELLQRRFEAAFWCERLSTYALALDGDKRPCEVVASNAGHALLTGIALPAHARRVAQTLLAGPSFSGWGIRTVALTEKRYNPMAYHNGSVWPHDNALIALGLARYGLKAEVTQIFQGLADAAGYMELKRLPELFCGFARRRRNAPTLYPVACAPQAWASAAIPALVQACLGLQVDALAHEVRFVAPVLPDFLDSLVLRGLRTGDGEVDVRVRRFNGGAECAIALERRTGAARVVVLH